MKKSFLLAVFATLFMMWSCSDTKDKKSKEDGTEELLKHEQGHFDVGLLYMQEVLQKMTGANFTRAGYKEEFQKLVSDIHQKYKDMGFQYDKETNHSIKKDEQKRWDTFFNESVKR